MTNNDWGFNMTPVKSRLKKIDLGVWAGGEGKGMVCLGVWIQAKMSHEPKEANIKSDILWALMLMNWQQIPSYCDVNKKTQIKCLTKYKKYFQSRSVKKIFLLEIWTFFSVKVLNAAFSSWKVSQIQNVAFLWRRIKSSNIKVLKLHPVRSDGRRRI